MSLRKSKPIAVLISDIHFTVPTLELASQSLLKAQFKAKMLDVPLVIAGDTLDSKAVMRAECVNRLLELMAVKDSPPTYIMTGNHDLLNEKGKEHSLNFLGNVDRLVLVVDSPICIYAEGLSAWLIPYQSDSAKLSGLLEKIREKDLGPKTLIMHQGLQSAHMGHYVVDKASLPKEAFADFRVISGHYHRAQNIKCGPIRNGQVGLFSYIGNPYSLSFGEANDGPKGFQILYDDGTLELVPTNLRKHVIKELRAESWQQEIGAQDPKDLLWVKISGPKSTLSTLTKADIAKVVGHAHFKLDLIPDTQTSQVVTSKNQTEEELLDSMVDSAEDTPEYKAYLKTLWRSII